MVTNYPIFAEYNYYIRDWLLSIMQLPRIDALGSTIPVIYSSPRRAFSTGSSSATLGTGEVGEKFYAPPGEGNNWLPIMTYRLNTVTPSLGKTIPYEHVLVQEVKDNNGNIIGFTKSKPFQVYEVSYAATLYTGLMQDADILSFKLLTEFRPNAHVWIGRCDKAGNNNYGVWAHMVFEGLTDATEYEPLDIGERVIRKDFSWKITDAFVPTIESSELDTGIIEEVFTDIYPS